MELPKRSSPRESVLEALEKARASDASWKTGKTFSLVYWAGDDVLELLQNAFFRYFSENALSPMAFPSLRRFESEVVAMSCALLGHADASGAMTSGGTESILMAVKTARDWAREKMPHVREPEMVVPESVHPAFEKAAHYFGLRVVHAPLDASFRVSVDAMRAAITENTILLVGSAPAYPHGVVDPIEEIAALAQARGILCHVDSCVGGFMLPFARKLGRKIPAFDFSVPGVTSMSADLHKYGWAAKGASVVLYRTRELRRHQFVVYTDWPGGLYGSPSAPGTRPGGPIAAAWAVMNYLGEEGYLRLAKTTLETTDAIVAAVRQIPELRVLGEPAMSVFSFASDVLDVYAVGDAMQERGFMLDRQQRPASLHMTITPAHAPHVDEIARALRESVEEVKRGAVANGSAAMYGMLGAMPDRAAVRDLVLEVLDGMAQ
ncbi:MAG TPA: aspartate aminotransferase family protein [Polyangiaceae bacterium]|jgi:glutamate/tyrosine decarboxylase-like PLP-dependent enzyme